MVKQAKLEKKGPAVKESPKRKADEIDEIVEEFLKTGAAKEAKQAAKRVERRGE